MTLATATFPVALGLILAKWAAQLWLEHLNRRNVLRHADAVPEAFRGALDPATYRKGVEYTLAKGKFSQFETSYHAVVLVLLLASGVLPLAFGRFQEALGASAASMAAFLFLTGVGLSLPGLPLEWSSQFRLEERFGFNTTTQKTWWTDRLKGLVLAGILGYPLLVLILKLVDWAGALWWVWAWALMVGFQLLMMVLAPVLILPLFNKFTPLPEGPLRERLLGLGRKTGFHAQSIQVMDGSKRSRHSNAFFTGFGRFRKIVLFDTLLQQLEPAELEAVLAHEIGHYKRRHIPKLLLASTLGMAIGFCLVAQLARQGWFYEGFRFPAGNIVPALLLFSLLSGTITFWFTPAANLLSRRFEYQADRYAADVMGESRSLIGALRKLNEKNLSNLTPHPAYSGFYYSHPTLWERERALKG